MKIEDVMDDLAARFLLTLPAEETNNTERLLFQVEEAHWFYEDYYKRKYGLPKLNLKIFTWKLVMHTKRAQSISEVDEEFKKFLKYKKTVPVFGALIFNTRMSKLLLVKGYGVNRPYTFPRGKISKAETAVQCAIREVREEIGYDIKTKIIKHICLDMSTTTKESKLYVVINVAESTKFKTMTRNEIQEIKWMDIEEIQKSTVPMLSYVRSNIEKIQEIAKRIESMKVPLDRKRIREAFGIA